MGLQHSVGQCLAIGGVGGRRFLGMTPVPGRRNTWTEMVRDHRNVRGLPISIVGNVFDKKEHVAQRSMPLSTGGEMKVFSSKQGTPMQLSSLLSHNEAARKFDSLRAFSGV